MDMDRIKGTVQQVGGKLQGVAGQVTGDHGMRASGIADEVAGTARALYGQAKDGLRDAVDTAADYAGLAQHQAHKATEAVSGYGRHAYDGGRHDMRERARTVEHHVERHPLMSLMIAGTVGYLLGFLMHMRR